MCGKAITEFTDWFDCFDGIFFLRNSFQRCQQKQQPTTTVTIMSTCDTHVNSHTANLMIFLNERHHVEWKETFALKAHKCLIVKIDARVQSANAAWLNAWMDGWMNVGVKSLAYSGFNSTSRCIWCGQFDGSFYSPHVTISAMYFKVHFQRASKSNIEINLSPKVLQSSNRVYVALRTINFFRQLSEQWHGFCIKFNFALHPIFDIKLIFII